MVDITKKDINTKFASVGSNIESPDLSDPSVIRSGFIAGSRPYSKWINYLYNWFSNNIAYLNQKGVPEWDAETDYLRKRSFVQHEGTLYFALLDSKDKNPSTETSYWGKVADDEGAYISAERVWEILKNPLGDRQIGESDDYVDSAYITDLYTRDIIAPADTNILTLRNDSGSISIEAGMSAVAGNPFYYLRPTVSGLQASSLGTDDSANTRWTNGYIDNVHIHEFKIYKGNSNLIIKKEGMNGYLEFVYGGNNVVTLQPASATSSNVGTSSNRFTNVHSYNTFTSLLGRHGGDGHTVNYNSDGAILQPHATNKGSIGISTYKYKDGYINNVYSQKVTSGTVEGTTYIKTPTVNASTINFDPSSKSSANSSREFKTTLRAVDTDNTNYYVDRHTFEFDFNQSFNGSWSKVVHNLRGGGYSSDGAIVSETIYDSNIQYPEMSFFAQKGSSSIRTYLGYNGIPWTRLYATTTRTSVNTIEIDATRDIKLLDIDNLTEIVDQKTRFNETTLADYIESEDIIDKSDDAVERTVIGKNIFMRESDLNRDLIHTLIQEVKSLKARVAELEGNQ